jgi:hypothetical protein
VREVYLLATESEAPLPLEELKDAFAAEDVSLVPLADGWGFQVDAEEGSPVHVRFEARGARAGWPPRLLTGSDTSQEALRRARGYYRVLFEPGGAQPTVRVFEALWCVRRLMEHVSGVLLDLTALKLHGHEDVTEITELDFDVRDHLNLHAVEAPPGQSTHWVHSHGMEKFGTRDVEVFRLGEEELAAAESFLNELCTGLAFGQGPPLRQEVGTSEGRTFLLLPSEEARANLLELPLDTFDGHAGHFFTVVSPGGRHTIGELLRPYRERFASEPEERREALQRTVRELLPAFKARFQRKGLMEPLTFLVRVPFETHPEGDTVTESLWMEVLGWEEETVTGKLVDGAAHTTEWRKGVHVEVDEEFINALALSREGQMLGDDEVRALLLAERPS